MKNRIVIAFFIGFFTHLKAQNTSQDAILGKWMSANKDLAVEVYKQNEQYQAKVIWFECYNNTKMSDYNDTENPNKALRNHPWLGLEVLNGLTYKGGTEWHNGSIYDPNTGHTFSSVCRLENPNKLKVRGYWLYEWIGKSLIFNRMNN
jgi:uncharacterized protein (DUF2147 family)